jgi:hypothetical protein
VIPCHANLHQEPAAAPPFAGHEQDDHGQQSHQRVVAQIGKLGEHRINRVAEDCTEQDCAARP